MILFLCRKYLICFFVVLEMLLFCVLGGNYSYAFFDRMEGVDAVKIKKLAISPIQKNLFYAASENILFKTDDNGESFKEIYVLKDECVRDIAFDINFPSTFYLIGSRSILKITDTIEKIFSAPADVEILSMTQCDNEIYVGTTQGLYYACRDNGMIWKRMSSMNDKVVCVMAKIKECLYIGTNKGVFSLLNKDTIDKLFLIREDGGEEKSGLDLTINCIYPDIFSDTRIWVGTNHGVFVSGDAGRNWEKVYHEELDSREILAFTQTKLEKDMIYIGTKESLLKYDISGKKVTVVTEGLYVSDVLDIAVSSSGEIYLATSQGLFKEKTYILEIANKIKGEVGIEPPIEEIQQAALRYNSVHPEKIQRWRKSLHWRALFPEIKLDYEKTISIYHNTNQDRILSGPLDWGISFSWNVGDLIWNSYEDDVDTRARLDTQMRLDLIDEINRVYFERIRVKQEINSVTTAKNEQFKRELRLQELTAILNGYTGGYFTRRAKELNAENRT